MDEKKFEKHILCIGAGYVGGSNHGHDCSQMSPIFGNGR